MTDEAPPPQRGAELASQAGLRASHVDRDRVVELLRVAAGDGRLTAEELDERLEAALTARTYGELAALTTDLPAVPDSAPGPPVPEPKDLARIDDSERNIRSARLASQAQVDRQLCRSDRSGRVRPAVVRGAAAGMTLAEPVDSSGSAGAVTLSRTGDSCLIGDFG